LAINNDIFIMSGPDVTGIKSGVLPWILVGLCALAMLFLLFAAVAHFVAWIGAVLNTAQLPDKTWFVVLLVVGLVFIATVAYVIAGPDGSRPRRRRRRVHYHRLAGFRRRCLRRPIGGPNQHVG
jgi:membrane protein implicated in regulation of membrane protease activity